ncbi:MAG: formate/nitrite transporter family protein, partial [bacterium]
ADEIHHSLYLSDKINKTLEKIKNRIGAVSGIEKSGGKEPSEIFKASVQVGLLRLNRNWLEMFMSGLIAGMNVTFGIIAASYVAGATEPLVGRPVSNILGALFFPIGLMFLLMGKSELFSENFLLPVTTVLAKKTKINKLFKLWGLTLAGNMGGIFLFALVIASSLGLLLPVFVINHIHTVAHTYMSRSPYLMVLSGVFAGWLITLMTWLLIASNGTLARMVIIWAVGFMVYLGSFSHVVVVSSEILISINTNSGMSYIPWLIKYVPLTILGNMIGGLFFVTIFQYLQILHAGGKTEMSLYSSSELDILSKAAEQKIEDIENIEDTL